MTANRAKAVVAAVVLAASTAAAVASPTITVSLPPAVLVAVTGRVRVYMASAASGACTPTSPPPRAQCDDSQETAQAFSVDTPEGGLLPGNSLMIDASTLAYPLHSLADVPPGEYCVQAELVLYDTYSRGDGVNLTLPVSCVNVAGGDGLYGTPPGTLYSDTSYGVHWPPPDDTLALTLGNAVPVLPSRGCSGAGADTQFIKTINVTSALLTKFWGREMTLQACVLLPWQFDERPTARYPLVVAHGHYSSVFDPGGRFSEQPPTSNLTGYDYVDQLYAHYLYTNWTSSDGAFKGARALVVTINHPVPFFDDSYAMDGANVGPYGTAIMTELLPAIETKYRGIGEGWARGVMGGSTGGWESFMAQVVYPDEFNYAAVACPDPISFSSYVTVDMRSAENGYYYDSPFKRTARPGVRDSYSGRDVLPGTSTPTYGHPYGHTSATIEEMNRRELVLGEHSRSCGQWDIWEAVFGPSGDDGYPARVWCKDPRPGACGAGVNYGDINRTVADYWIANYDMLERVKSRWAPEDGNLGAKLSGKLHVFVGGSDTFFLTDAVMDFQTWAMNASLTPPFNGTVAIGTHDGRGYEHCFNGYLPDGSVAPNAITRELYVTKFVPRMAERWAATAPAGANMEWRSY